MSKTNCPLEDNARQFGIKAFGHEDHQNGIVHVVGPELGFTHPGMTIVAETAIHPHMVLSVLWHLALAQAK